MDKIQQDKPFFAKTYEKLQKIFGNLAYFDNKKVFFTMLLTTNGENSLEDLHIINKNDKCPKCPEDWWMYCFLRAYCHSLLNSVTNFREEQDTSDAFTEPNYGEYTDIGHYYYYGEDVNSELPRPKKPIFAMSKTVKKEELFKLKPFTENFANTIVTTNKLLEPELSDPNFVASIREKNIDIIDDPIENVEDAIDYLINKRRYRSVLVETGTTLTNRVFENPSTNPIEVVVLSVYDGKVDPTCFGKQFVPYSLLLKQYDLVYQTAVPTSDIGSLTFYILLKKEKYTGV